MRGLKKYAPGIISLFVVVCMTACASKYSSTECASPLPFSYYSSNSDHFYRPEDRALNFNHIIEENGLYFYYESGLGGRKIDHGVDSVKRVREFCDVPQSIYLLEDTVTHVNSDGLWVNPNDNVELIGAVLLENAAETELPFGIFAGVSANLLGENIEYSVYSESRLESRLKEYFYVKELQYPLYTERETTKNERETAWNYAYKLGEAYLAEHTVDELMRATLEDISPVLDAVGATLPDYHFPVGDYLYPTQVITDNLHYYFAFNYEDSEFNKDLLKYTVLTDFISENEVMIKEVAPIYGLNDFLYRMDIYFGKKEEFGISTSGYTDMGRNAIACYTAGITAHEIMHCIAYWGDCDGYFSELICSYFGIKYSYYARHREYLDYSLQTKNRETVYTDETIKILKDARNLYNKTFGKCSMSDFNALAWLQCGTYLFNQESTQPTPRVVAQGVTMVQYVYETYGFDTLMEINRSYRDANINGKTYYDFENEWADWIKNIFANER